LREIFLNFHAKLAETAKEELRKNRMKLAIICVSLCFLIGCGNAAKPVGQNTNALAVSTTPEKPQTAIAHSSEDQTSKPVAPVGDKSKWTASGDPIDTKELDSGVMAAEKALGSKPKDTAAKKALADAFYKRGVALTEARQYASALGDYRRTLGHDPTNAGAKEWIEKIVMIYDSMGRQSPKEGEEPPPLPFTKK